MAIILHKDRFVTNSMPVDALVETGAFRAFEGGFYELNAIPQERRKPGMICSIDSGAAYYVLRPGPWSYSESDWYEIEFAKKTKNVEYIDKETIDTDIDGINTIFALAFSPVSNSEHIFINGILQLPGEDADYVIENNTVTFSLAPLRDSVIICSYRYEIDIEETPISKFADKEIPALVQETDDRIFTLSRTPIIRSEHVYVNGMLQRHGDIADYVIENNQIIFTNAVPSGSNMLCTYRYM